MWGWETKREGKEERRKKKEKKKRRGKGKGREARRFLKVASKVRARLKPIARNSFLTFHTGDKSPDTWSTFRCFSRHISKTLG